MLTRYWQWTSGAATPAESSLPFGPLRWRAWTSQAADAAVAGLPFGPLRFEAAYPLLKAEKDKTEWFRFSVGTAF